MCLSLSVRVCACVRVCLGVAYCHLLCRAVSLQQVMHDQDRDLQKVHHSLHTLGQMGEEMGNELDDQNR